MFRFILKIEIKQQNVFSLKSLRRAFFQPYANAKNEHQSFENVAHLEHVPYFNFEE